MDKEESGGKFSPTFLSIRVGEAKRDEIREK